MQNAECKMQNAECRIEAQTVGANHDSPEKPLTLGEVDCEARRRGLVGAGASTARLVIRKTEPCFIQYLSRTVVSQASLREGGVTSNASDRGSLR